MTKDERIKEELNRITELFNSLPEAQLELLRPLMQNAAFMKITLEDLQEQVKKDGPVETYTNGANQTGRKQSSALQAYDKIIKDYAGVMKTLSNKVPTRPIHNIVMPKKWEPREKTEEEIEEEIEEEMRREDEKAKRVKEEIARAQKKLDEMHQQHGYGQYAFFNRENQ